MSVEVLTRRTCEVCNGLGVVYKPSCRHCLRALSHEELFVPMALNSTMPCGHSWSFLIEEISCSECKGCGRIEEWAVIGGASFRRGESK